MAQAQQRSFAFTADSTVCLTDHGIITIGARATEGPTLGFAAPLGQDQALGPCTGRKAASSDGFAGIEHPVTVAIKAGVAQDLAHIGLTIVVAIFLALVRNLISIAILGTIGQVTLVGNPVEVAIGKAFTFIRNGV